VEAARRESYIDRLGLWAGGWALSAAVWWPIQIVFHPDEILGDGALGGIGLLIMFVLWVLLAVLGVPVFREATREQPARPTRLATTKVIGLGVAAWIVERQALVAGNDVARGVAFAASLLMPFAFIAALMIVTGEDRQQRRGWQTLAGLAVVLACLRIA
jgi:hypothetical protein